MKWLFTLIFAYVATCSCFSQSAPAEDENIPYLITFGKKAETSWGDDDFAHIFFFLIPEKYTKPIYIRIYDPDCGGEIDELNGIWDSETRFPFMAVKNVGQMKQLKALTL